MDSSAFSFLLVRDLNPRPFCHTMRRHRRLTWGCRVARQKTSKRRFLSQRNRPKQGVEGGSRRPTRHNYAKAAGQRGFPLLRPNKTNPFGLVFLLYTRKMIVCQEGFLKNIRFYFRGFSLFKAVKIFSIHKKKTERF